MPDQPKSLLVRPTDKENTETTPEMDMSQEPLESLEAMETRELDEQRLLLSPLVSRIISDLSSAETSRTATENQWIRNINGYRAIDSTGVGKNGDSNEFRASEELKPYIRTTTVKTRAAYSQIMESLMQNSRFPLMIEPTPSPEGVPESVTNDPNAKESQQDFGIGFEGDGKEMNPGSTEDELSWKENDSLYANMKEGRDKSGGQYGELRPADKAAAALNKVIMDQLEESNAHTELRKSVFEACLLGTGIMKGVFSEMKTIHKWVDGKYSPIRRKFPKLHSVSAWDIYIDPNALIYEDAEWIIERHRMTAKQLRDLKNRENFDAATIDRCITGGANYVNKSFEHIVREEDAIMDKSKLWEVYEYWGYISKEEALEVGLPIDENSEQVQVNCWICGTEVLRVITNPFLPQRLPYFLFNYEVSPYNIYGTGVPETMEDSQKMMNGFARLAVDNLALAGNMVFDVDESMLVPGQDMSIYPGKVFRRQGGQAGSAINGVKFPSTANENMLMFREFRQIADESTGIPSVSHGQTGVTGVGRTSSGLNMILENASLNIKTVIRNIDDDLLQPLGKMLFYWNYQFNYENIPKGDFDVIATGIRSFTKQEVKVQRIQTLLGLTQNPAIAPMVKLPYIIRELVKGMDMDPEAVINDIDEAKVYAEIIGMAGGVSAQSKQANGIQNSEAPAGATGNTGNTEGAGNPTGSNGTPSEGAV
jgi:hypothetical protein